MRRILEHFCGTPEHPEPRNYMRAKGVRDLRDVKGDTVISALHFGAGLGWFSFQFEASCQTHTT
jgi:hypothetical protein